jgi:hypothetical protein
MARTFFRPLAAVILVLSLVSIVHGAGARFWEVGTLNDFLKGDATSLSVDLHGRLILGPALTELADTASPVLWTGIEGSDGDIYLGSGNDGRVLKISRDGTSRVFFDSNELEVHALARAPGGGLYVGTSPDGRIYKVDSTGKGTEFFDPDERYIWALAVAPDGAVFAATGDKGLVYRITPDGKGSVFYKTKSTHVRSLLLTASGELLAGTESPGRVFRIGQDGSGFLVLDASLQEISALRAGLGGVVYAAAQTGKASDDRPSSPPAMPDTSRQTPLPTVSTEITAVAVVGDQGSSGSSSASRESGRASGKGAVYRIQPDGVWDQVWSSADDAPYDVALDGQGGLLVATGGKGKIYRVTGEPTESTLLTRAPAQQVTSLIADGARGLLITTANPGKILRLSADPSTTGSYESDVRDAEAVATWGAISWRGAVPQGTDVRLFTRTGNTAAPDDTWSPWSVAYRRPEGEQITSPKARYLQWKVELAGAGNRSPVVTSVTVAFQQRNLRPEITSITVHPAGVVFQRPFSTGEAEIAGYDGSTIAQRVQSGSTGGNPVLGRRGYQKGLQTFLWKAQDPNDDDLTYDILYRREGETNWKALKRNLTDPILVWDTTSVPNGTYVIKVVASDASANPPGAALVAERESDTFDIDNAPPMITINSVSREAGRTIVRFVVKDADFPVQRVEYSLDADRWRPLYPRDGIADSRTEEFELTLDQDVSEKAIILRAFDGMNNVATARAEAPVPTTTGPTR